MVIPPFSSHINLSSQKSSYHTGKIADITNIGKVFSIDSLFHGEFFLIPCKKYQLRKSPDFWPDVPHMQYLSQLFLRHRSWAGGFLVVVCSYHRVFHHLIRLKSYFFRSIHERGTDCFQCKPISVIGICPKLKDSFICFPWIFIIPKSLKYCISPESTVSCHPMRNSCLT